MKLTENIRYGIRKILPLMFGVLLIIGVLVVTGYFRPVMAFEGYPMGIRAAFVQSDCFIDANGANDEPGQKDLTKACIESASKDPVHVTWNWDITGLKGNNSADGCALFDTNLNGFTDYAICNSFKSTPPVKTAGYPVLYVCNDTRPDRCAGGVVTPITTTTCTIALGDGEFPFNDPFAAGESYPLDTISDCYIALMDVGSPTYPVNLLNVCSYPAPQPNSDPSDCVITSDTQGNLEIHKDVVPDDPTTNWDISISGPTNFTDVLTGDDTTYNKIVVPGTYTISESAGLNTSNSYASNWVCTNSAVDPAVVRVGTGTVISDLSITAGSVWDCTFTNELRVDIMVTQTDVLPTFPPIKRIGEPFRYTIQINHTDSYTGLTAANVSVLDTLDPWLDYISDEPGYIYTVEINNLPVEPLPVCTWSDDNSDGRGGTFSCPNIGDLASDEIATITFWVKPVNGAPVNNLIENGACTQNPGMQGTNPVDICNIVSVSTTSPEVTIANNQDSEPADIGVPMAVEVTWFDVTKEGRNGIWLGWETANENEVVGFNVYRSGKPLTPNKLMNKDIINALTPGEFSGAVYSYRDNTVKPKKLYYYWLEVFSTDGNVDLYGPVSGELKR